MGDSFIIAINFSTAYSGYVFSLTKREAEVEPRLRTWGEQVALRTPKTPTCILFDEHEEFLSFGYEAQSAYFRLRGEEARKKFFFEYFKMSLYGRRLNSDVTIEAANGKSMKALKVFTEALRFLKEDALKYISENTSGRLILTASDFTWVLTVPAIWDPSAKQFMREAATEAGIVMKGREDRLVIALEPEAASVWCKKLPADGFQAESQVTFDPTSGTQYIVVDCGGKNIDITVHKVLGGGALKMLLNEMIWGGGGQTVDRKFKEFLREIFGDGVWDEYESEHPRELQRMMDDVSILKEYDDDMEIRFPFNLGAIALQKQEIEKFFESVRGASWNHGSIRISKWKLRSFFAESLNDITKSLNEILKKDFRIEYILLVGGYANSKILRKHVMDQFGEQCKVLCPFSPEYAVMQGAVLLGRNPAVVASRISAYTYGISTSQVFSEKHKKESYTNSEGEWCLNTFLKLVEVGEEVTLDETRKHILYPLSADQTEMKIMFYCTEMRNPKFVNNDEISEHGFLPISMPDTTRGTGRQVHLEIRFGFSEMTATATVSKSTASITMDFETT